jgi:hypothetical protein
LFILAIAGFIPFRILLVTRNARPNNNSGTNLLVMMIINNCWLLIFFWCG